MRPRSQERAQFLADIIVGAVEGGTGYWACVSEYRHDIPDATYAVLHEEDEDGAIEGTGTAPKPLHLGIDEVASALAKIESGDVEMNESLRKHLIDANRENDACNIDANDADIVAQVALLGEIVYG